jgi:hypothetical protein
MDIAILKEVITFVFSLGIQTPAELPDVILVEPIQLSIMAGYSGLMTIKGACVNGRIYLNNTVDLTTIEGRAVLAHEYTHYTQNKCPIEHDALKRQQKEDEAYAVQNEYLKAHGSVWRALDPWGHQYELQIKPKKDVACISNCGTIKPEAAEQIRKRFEASDVK